VSAAEPTPEPTNPEPTNPEPTSPEPSPAVAALCERLRRLLAETDCEVMTCDVGALVEPDASTVDALAQLQLAARRLGCRIELCHASLELQELLALMGLDGVVPTTRRT
jgi:ABC-type transporter Mla MlaB component